MALALPAARAFLMPAPAAKVLWYPTKTNTPGLNFLIDAQKSVITQSGGLVTNVTDLSGNAKPMTATTGGPTYTASSAVLNNKPALLNANGGTMTGGPVAASSAGGTSFALNLWNAPQLYGTWGSQQFYTSNGYVANTPVLMFVNCDTATGLNVYINGSATSTGPYSGVKTPVGFALLLFTPISGGAYNNVYTINKLFDSGDNMALGMLGTGTSAVVAANRAQLEGCAAWEYGLQTATGGVFPTTHTYYAAPPYQ